MVQERLAREGLERPVEILVLTFNRTLSGYVRVLADEQIRGAAHADMTIETFGSWAMAHLGWPRVVQEGARDVEIQRLAAGLPFARRYVAGEVDYLLGRLEPEQLERYLTEERTGRGERAAC